MYVHIPFCVKKCAYCDFLSAPAEESVQKAYVERLLYIAEDRADALHGESRKGYPRYKRELQRKLKKQGILK